MSLTVPWQMQKRLGIHIGTLLKWLDETPAFGGEDDTSILLERISWLFGLWEGVARPPVTVRQTDYLLRETHITVRGIFTYEFTFKELLEWVKEYS